MEVEWTEHTAPDGRHYYFNRKTQVSAWDKPAELQTPEERACVWREYISEGNKVYYHNTATKQSVWVMPEELKLFKQRKAATDAAAAAAAADPLIGYRQALEAAQVPANATWEQAMLATINDERYKNVVNLNDKKKVFLEYIDVKKKAEEVEKRQRDEQRRKDFVELLHERKDVVVPRAVWKKTAPVLERDQRFYALEDEEEREEVFEDFVYELERKEKEAEKEARRVGAERFKELLAEPAVGVNAITTWRRFREQHGEEPRFKAADKLDRLRLFEEYVRGLEKADGDARRLERDAQKRKSRVAREAFRAVLRQMSDNNQITLKTTWTALLPSIAAQPVYTEMLSSDYVGSAPKQLFDDVIDELDEAFERDRKKLRDQLRAGTALPSKPTREQVLEALKSAPNGEERLSGFPSAHLDLFVSEVLLQEEEKEKEEARRRTRELERLLDSLTTELRTALVAPDAAYDAMATSLDLRPPFAQAKPESRPQLFSELVSLAMRRAKERETQAAKSAELEVQREKERKEREERDKERKDKDKDERRERDRDRDRDRDRERRDHKEKKDEVMKDRDGAEEGAIGDEEEGAIVEHKKESSNREKDGSSKKEKKEHRDRDRSDRHRDRSDRERSSSSRRRHSHSRRSPSRSPSRSRSRSPRR